MLIITYGVCVRNAEGGTDFFAVNASSPGEAREIVLEIIENNDDYPQGNQAIAEIQAIAELLHEQFRGVVKLGAL